MPFTTPWLAGARVRDSERSGIELVVPNPSGGRGVYVLRWPDVREMCRPTVHDTMLFRRCSRLIGVDPARVRDAALDVAQEGHAGQQAATAAEAAIASDQAERLLGQFLLLTGLMQQIDPHGPKTTSLNDRTPAFDHQASQTLYRIAPSLGRPATDLAAGLAVAGNGFAAVGIAEDDRQARLPRLLMRLRQAGGDLADWLDADPGHDVGGLGQAVVGAMGQVCDCGDAMLRQIRTLLADPMALLALWVRQGAAIVARADRCLWLLDGWERVALLWLLAESHAARRAVLLEMASLMPVLPLEAKQWTDTPIPATAMEQAFRVTSRENAWRTGGAAFALIARNERLLAMSS